MNASSVMSSTLTSSCISTTCSENSPEGTTVAFPPPSIPGVGASGGVTYILEDRGGHDFEFLAANTKLFLQAAAKRPEIARIFTTLIPDVPQVYVNVDRDKVLTQGVQLKGCLRHNPDFHGRRVYQLLQSIWPPVAGVHPG